MNSLDESAAAFLSLKRVAVVGVRLSREDSANIIYRTLKKSGYAVAAVNPNAATFDGDTCYADVMSIPGRVDAAVIVLRPDLAEVTARQCAEAGITTVWIHRPLGFLRAALSSETIRFCRSRGTQVLTAGCPMMFIEPVDGFHRCLRWLIRHGAGGSSSDSQGDNFKTKKASQTRRPA